jgi:hypothetical protein
MVDRYEKLRTLITEIDVHPSPKHMEAAFARLEAYNERKRTRVQ